jgi:hypothetical protein
MIHEYKVAWRKFRGWRRRWQVATWLELPLSRWC